MDKQQKINQLGLRFGLSIMESGAKMAKASANIKVCILDNPMIKNFLNEQTGVPFNSISLADEKYHITNLDKVKEIIEYDLIDTRKYVADSWDCENFALAFASRAGYLYGLNSFGVAFGGIYDANTKQWKFNHGFNLIITQDNGVLHLYLYEPQNDKFILWQKGQNNVILPLGIYKLAWLFYY